MCPGERSKLKSSDDSFGLANTKGKKLYTASSVSICFSFSRSVAAYSAGVN